MALGYALMGMVGMCLVSGAMLTWQAAAGTKCAGVWRLLHPVSGIAAFGLGVAHLILAFARRRPAAGRASGLRPPFREFARRSTIWTGAALAPVAAAAAFRPSQPARFPPPEGYSLPAYVQQFDEYRGNPFAPSYARTRDGLLVAPEALSHSEACGTSGCHEQILSEWQPSAHRFSAVNPIGEDGALSTSGMAEPRIEIRGCFFPLDGFRNYVILYKCIYSKVTG